MFGEEMENYCGNCGHQLESESGNCPYCGAPLSITLVTVSKRQREWTNPDRWQIGRKGWIQAKFFKRWIPKYEEWLYNTKHKSLGELGTDENKQMIEEYKKFLEERTKQRESWKVLEAEKGKCEEKAEKTSDEEFKKWLIDKIESLSKDVKRLVDSLGD